MGVIKIPSDYAQKSVLLADDEPEHLDWLVDYLSSKGLLAKVVTNVQDAIKAVEQKSFRAYFIDLNIPLGGWKPTLSQTGPTYEDYHGLYIIKLVRSQGLAGKRVIAYSAHYNESIANAIKRLYCRYIVKGRPRELKVEIEDLLSREPPPPRMRKVVKKKPLLAAKKTRKPARFRKTS